MKLILKEKLPMFRKEFGKTEPIWFEAGEEFEVVDTKVMKHDGRKWFIIKSKWFKTQLEGIHNPDNFEVIL